jgi:hypothetical protein
MLFMYQESVYEANRVARPPQSGNPRSDFISDICGSPRYGDRCLSLPFEGWAIGAARFSR